MQLLVNHQNLTPFLAGINTVRGEARLSDPIGKAYFLLDDPGSLIALSVGQEVILVDETVMLAPAGSGSGGSSSSLFVEIANAVSSTLSTANQLYTINGGTPSSVNPLTTINNSTGWGEMPSQGSGAAWPSLGAIGAPTGKGFFLDSSILDSQSLFAGNWTGSTRISAQAAGTISGTIVVRFFKYSAGVYTNIVTFTLTGQSLTTTIATQTLPSSTGVSMSFNPGDKLYMDKWFNCTANTSGAGQQLRDNRQSTDSVGKTGDSNTQIFSPGFGSTGSFVPSPAAPSVPAHNYLNNNNFNFAGGAWPTSGSLAARITFPVSGTFGAAAACTMSLSNNVVGIGTAAQAVNQYYAQPGQQYCLSAKLNITTAFVNSDVYLQIQFFDKSGSVLSQPKSIYSANTGGYTRVSMTATAPAGTVNVSAVLGIETTNATNSGTALWTAVQLEPMWFVSGPGASYVASYPTSICDFLQPDCATVVDGTTVRNNRIFCGTISFAKPTYNGNNRIWNVECNSLAAYLETDTLVNATYSNAQDTTIISNAIASCTHLVARTPASLDSTGPDFASANATPIVPTQVIASLTLPDATPREVLNACVAQTGNVFGADAYGNVFYTPPKYQIAPYGFSTSPDSSKTFAYYDYAPEFDGTQIRNIVNVSGGQYLVTITENFHANDGTHAQFINGSSQMVSFQTTYTAVNTPTLVVNGSTLSVGVNTSFGTSYTAVYSTAYNQMNLLNPAPSGQSVSVTYQYSALVYVQVEDPVSVAQFGPRWSKVNDTSIVTLASAQARGEQELSQYSQPQPTVKFKTQQLLQPGWVIPSTSPNDGWSPTHLTVQSVIATWLGNGINQYEVEAGAFIPNFIDYMRNVQKAISRGNSQAGATIAQKALTLLSDTVTFGDSLNIH